MKHNTSFKLLSTSALLISILATTNAHAVRNGALPCGLGARVSLGGAGTALPLDIVSDVDVNPALTAQTGNHAALFVGTGLQKHKIDTRATPNAVPVLNPAAPGGVVFLPLGNTSGVAKNKIHSVPFAFFGANYMLNDQVTLGMAFLATSTQQKYDKPVFNPRLSTHHTRMAQPIYIIAPTMSYKVADDHSYGISALIGYSSVRSNLVDSNLRLTKGSMKTDHAYGFGVKVGGFWGISDAVKLGAAASTPLTFQKFKKYSDNLPSPLVIPATYKVGVNVTMSEGLNLLLDVKEIRYRDVKWFKRLGWNNQTSYMVGVQYKFNPEWTMRAGYNYGKSPIPKGYVLRNALAPFISEQTFGLAAVYNLPSGLSVELGGGYTPSKSMTDNGSVSAAAKGAKITVKEETTMRLGLVWKY